jgi:hypothetical protein
MTTREFVGVVTNRGNRHRGPLVSYKVVFKSKRMTVDYTMVDRRITLRDFMEELRLNNRKANRDFSYEIVKDKRGLDRANWTLSYAGHTQTGYANRANTRPGEY